MAKTCTYTIDGVTYSEKDFKSFLLESGLDNYTAEGLINIEQPKAAEKKVPPTAKQLSTRLKTLLGEGPLPYTQKRVKPDKEAAKKIEKQRDAEIKKATVPTIETDEITVSDFEKSNLGSKELVSISRKNDRIKNNFEALLKLSDCIWGQAR